MALLLSILLTSCGKKDLTAFDVWNDFSALSEIPSCEIYRYASDNGNDRILSRLYGDTDVMTYCDDYVIGLYFGDEVWEIHILRTVSVYDNEKVAELLLGRRDMLQMKENVGFLSEESEARVREAEIIEKNNFVILAITDQNSVIRKTRLFS